MDPRPGGHGGGVDLAREPLADAADYGDAGRRAGVEAGGRAARAARATRDDSPAAGDATADATGENRQRGEAALLDFEQVYDQHFDFVWRTVRRLGVAERALDDAAQDVFLVVYRRLGDFEGRSSMRSWIYGITRRVARDHRRRAMRKDRAGALPEGLADPGAGSPMEDTSRAEALAALHRILGSLDADKREVFVLAELEQMSVPEIADSISANVNTVYSRLRAARSAFNQAVARYRASERSLP